MNEEEWRPAPGWPDYEVSESGALRRCTPGQSTFVGRVLAGRIDHKGYRVYRMPGGGLSKAHRLVAIAWHGAPSNGQIVRHLDGDSLNNHFSNLAWGSAQENSDDRVAHGMAFNHNTFKTHCIHGHRFSAENTSIELRNGRVVRRCRTCRADSSARQRQRRATRKLAGFDQP